MAEKRYRVTDVRAYINFDGVVVASGNLVPKEIEVEEWLVEAGWVEEK